MDDPIDDAGADEFAALKTQWTEQIGHWDVLNALLRRHREGQRRYHTVDHVVAVVRHVNELAESESVADLGAVVAAAWFHDAVYEPRSPSNERASARLARRDLTGLGWNPERADSVGTMIEGTAGHAAPADVDTAVLFDADLAILGATPTAYAAYVEAVRSEYDHVDDDTWRSGRADVLAEFLARERIFNTATGIDRWEASARVNLQAELDALQA